MLPNFQRGADRSACQGVGDLMDGALIHSLDYAKPFSIRQANIALLRQLSWHDKLAHMQQDKPRPFADIAERIKWHREVVLKCPRQEDYATSIGVKRSALSLWEAGTHRLSLDGALALRSKYGLSLDFMYEGIDDALPMTLRNAWRERS
ncbi:helix-turn-helix domain-containing protein [Falsirhodobacter sp. 20TX0035]|uniref:helix-turn-helix domain-containing protein n=1 Tax=Falsirhodobacter sp. 20TX0035 TaxID=3022019 RepID=UPI00232D99EF|nr:helix-turn-helix transcriptional regulator [Falsirhodobacter sp. 20TX0035]MDB6454732.1 helix-turn-helix transcriptional regulator [Falsirhodobacter sp. 20TX0035]